MQSKTSFSFLACLLVLLFGSGELNAQKSDDRVWSKVDEALISRNLGPRHISPEKYLTYRLNAAALQSVLSTAPLEFTQEARDNQAVITIPSPDGKFVRFRLEESPLLSPEIAAQFPTWKTYQGYGIDDPTATARFDWTESGFHAYVLSSENGTYSIDPYQMNDRANYQVYYKKDTNSSRQFHCDLDEMLSEAKTIAEVTDSPLDFAPQFSHGAQMRTYRIGIGTTFEFTNLFRQAGDTDAQTQVRAFSAVTTTVNRVTGVYRKDLAVNFTLVSGVSTIYVVNPETPADYANTGSPDLNANVTNLNNALTINGYDIGHVFGSSDNGIAQLSSVCGANKARGYSGQPNPVGDGFDIDYVAHEMGHQFAANHTFNATADCNAAPTIARREPGSAVTIMGYAGICSGGSDVARHSIDTFHVYNQSEAIAFLTTGGGATCGTLAGLNAIPIITPAGNFTIPFNTPFSLSASATDLDSNPLTYSWEQNDPSASPSNYPAVTDDDDLSLIFRPGFRSYLPSTSGTRSFPSLTYILNNANEAPVSFTGMNPLGVDCGDRPSCISGEDLPSEARTMNFHVTVRDGQGGVADAGSVLTVINTTTPFRVASPNSGVTWYAGANPTIAWDVSGTNGGSINVANVKISLSTDGGLTFPTVLFASTPNDGSQSIASPLLDTLQARIKVEAVGNIFFDISDTNFRIVSTPAQFAFIGGRITRPSGRGIGRIYVTLTGGSEIQKAITNSFGYYSFPDVQLGQTYTITPTPFNGITFNPSSIVHSHSADVSNLNFTSQ